MHREKAVSEHHEMYLKTLYEIQQEQGAARVGDIAEGLGISPASVSVALKKLKRLRLVNHKRYGLVSLTEAGSRLAECVVDRFETLRAVLIEVFGVDPETASVDACMMEHAVSPGSLRRMRLVLEAVRDGRTEVPGRQRAQRPDRECSECEARGVCQAGVNLIADLSPDAEPATR